MYVKSTLIYMLWIFVPLWQQIRDGRFLSKGWNISIINFSLIIFFSYFLFLYKWSHTHYTYKSSLINILHPHSFSLSMFISFTHIHFLHPCLSPSSHTYFLHPTLISSIHTHLLHLHFSHHLLHSDLSTSFTFISFINIYLLHPIHFFSYIFFYILFCLRWIILRETFFWNYYH